MASVAILGRRYEIPDVGMQLRSLRADLEEAGRLATQATVAREVTRTRREPREVVRRPRRWGIFPLDPVPCKALNRQHNHQLAQGGSGAQRAAAAGEHSARWGCPSSARSFGRAATWTSTRAPSGRA